MKLYLLDHDVNNITISWDITALNAIVNKHCKVHVKEANKGLSRTRAIDVKKILCQSYRNTDMKDL